MSIKIESQTPSGHTAKSKNDHSSKVIKTPGSAIIRVAQACDRCRAKKTKCDGQNPCSSCVAIGIECLVSDKLSRRAFPKGYTETLEERIRQLETENKKLTGLLDIRDEQLEILNSSVKEDPLGDNLNLQRITSSNLNALSEEHLNLHTTHHHHHHHHGEGCGCSNPHAVHERPVSIAGSIYQDHNRAMSIADSVNLSDDERDSLLSIDYSPQDSPRVKNKNYNFSKVNPAPHAFAAATAIAQMSRNSGVQQQIEDENSKQQKLTSLVAISIPRSTEETLFIPTLLARICQVHGYNSKPALLTAHAIASLKENSYDAKPRPVSKNVSLIMNREESNLSETEANIFLKELIKLPESRMELDHLITVYFQDWGNALPILDKHAFLKNYVQLTKILEENKSVAELDTPGEYEPIEKFGAMVVLVVALSLLSNKLNYIEAAERGSTINGSYIDNLQHYDYLIHEFIKPNCIITKHCSIQSLKILSLSLQYCLVTGDITTCYELRGRVITMAQQLRLHRCPAAVLGGFGGDVKLQNFMQGERRILFWCVYCLDVYSSLNLGIPRLLKDFEIECALPFSGKNDDDTEENENILIVNNKKLSIVGKVSKFALSMMLYCKVLGNNLDSIFSRFENTDAQNKAISRDRMLECWRRELPNELKFEIDVNGFSLKNSDNSMAGPEELWKNYSKQQLTLIFLYFHAKTLIYLPIVSKYGNHHNVGLSQKEQLFKEQGVDLNSIVPSVNMIQQASLQILEVLRSLSKSGSSYLLPIPINIEREQARFALLVAKGSLDYMKGGPLFQTSKQLLLDSITSLNLESSHDIPGSLTKNSVKLLEFSILSILGINISKNSSTLNSSKRKPSPPFSMQPITKTAVERAPSHDSNKFRSNKPSKLAVEIHDDSWQPTNPDVSRSFTEDDGLESILNFDPFTANVNRQMLMNEFAADGSLGLVPFLELTNEDNAQFNPIQDFTPQMNFGETKGDLFDWMT